MNALAKASFGLVAAALIFAVPAGPVASQSPPTTASVAPMAFGMNANSIADQTAAGVKPDYGTFWLGPWTLSSGWGGPDAQLSSMRSQGITPAIHLYYWGDDISKDCLENGCYSSLHKAQKDKAGWQALTDQTIEHLNARMGGKPVVIFLETEFNKGGVATYEPLDGYLEEKAKQIKAGYPHAKVVMALGNWGQSSWGTWDRTAAASDYVGIQGMRGSTKQTATEYATLYEGVLSGAKTAQAKFGKPVFLQDIALSTYPEPDYLKRQSDELGQFFRELDALQAAGVQAVVYRTWRDNPSMDTANWYGEAERHWGLTWAGNGTYKPSAQVWIDGVKAERAGAPPTPTSTTSATTAPPTTSSSPTPTPTAAPTSSGTSTTAKPPTSPSSPTSASATSTTTGATTAAKPYSATFTTQSGANAYWVEVKAAATPAPVKVEVKAGSGAWQPLVLRSWGAWGDDIAIAKGTAVSFRATAPDGQTATSAPAPWLGTATMTATGTTAPAPTTSAAATTTASKSTTTAPATTSSTTFTAKFTPKGVGSDWWVETAVSGSQPVAKVEAKVGSTAGWTTLPQQDWGGYAKSVHAPNGTYVQFRATSSTGAVVTSPTYVWG